MSGKLAALDFCVAAMQAKLGNNKKQVQETVMQQEIMQLAVPSGRPGISWY
jgi:hypothetical protein